MIQIMPRKRAREVRSNEYNDTKSSNIIIIIVQEKEKK